MHPSLIFEPQKSAGCILYYGADKRYAWRDYFTHEGMPLILSQKTHEDQSKHLKDLFENIYFYSFFALKN